MSRDNHIDDDDSSSLPPTPDAFHVQCAFEKIWRSISFSHHHNMAHQSLCAMMARYIKRMELYRTVIKYDERPWKDDPEACAIAAEKPKFAHGLQGTPLEGYVILKGRDLRAFSFWIQKNRDKLSPQNPSFTFERCRVEIRFDKFKMFSAYETSPMNNRQDRTRPLKADEASRLKRWLEGEMMCFGYRVLLIRTVTSYLNEHGVVKNRSSVRYIPLANDKTKFPNGEELCLGLSPILIGSFLDHEYRGDPNSPGALHTPISDEHFFNSGGYYVSGTGKFMSIACFESKLQHHEIICKNSKTNEPMLIFRGENITTGSLDNFVLRMEFPKVTISEQEDLNVNPTMSARRKPVVGRSGAVNIFRVVTQHTMIMPNAELGMNVPTAILAANKYLPNHGNGMGFDRRHEQRIAAHRFHAQNFMRQQLGLSSLTDVHRSLDQVSPFQSSDDLTEDDLASLIKEKKNNTKIVESMCLDTRELKELQIQTYVQRVLVPLPIMLVFKALGVTTYEKILALVSNADEQMDLDDFGRPLDPTTDEDRQIMYDKDQQFDQQLPNEEAAIEALVDGFAVDIDGETVDIDGEAIDDDDNDDDVDMTSGNSAHEKRERLKREKEEKKRLQCDAARREIAGAFAGANAPANASPASYSMPLRRRMTLHERRLTYQSILDRSWELNQNIKTEIDAQERIGYIYINNIQPEFRTRKTLEYAWWFLCKRFMPMQTMSEDLREDDKLNVPFEFVERVVEEKESDAGDQTSENVVMDESVRKILWQKAVALGRICNKYLRVMSGFRGEKYGQLHSPDENQIGTLYDITNPNFRTVCREIKKAITEDITQKLCRIFDPLQPYFQPHLVYRNLFEHKKREHQQSNATGEVGKYIVYNSSSPYPYCLQALANKYPTKSPITQAMCDITTQSEKYTHKKGASCRQNYQRHSLWVKIDSVRRILSMMGPHAGSLSRQLKANQQGGVDLLNSSTNDKSGLSNVLSALNTVSPQLLQSDHAHIRVFLQTLVDRNLLLSASTVYDMWNETFDARESVFHHATSRLVSAGGLPPAPPASTAWNPRKYYSLYCGPQWMGWIPIEKFAKAYEEIVDWKCGPTSSDGIRLISLELIHEQLILKMHFNRGRRMWPVYRVDQHTQTLRIARTSKRIAQLWSQPADAFEHMSQYAGGGDGGGAATANTANLTKEDFYRELIQGAGVEWIDMFQARRMVIADSPAHLIDSRQSGKRYDACHITPMYMCGPNMMAMPFTQHNGFARVQPAVIMRKHANGSSRDIWPLPGESRPRFTLTYGQRSILHVTDMSRTSDVEVGIVAFSLRPECMEDASLNCVNNMQLGSGEISINSRESYSCDLTRSQAEMTLQVKRSKVRRPNVSSHEQMGLVDMQQRMQAFQHQSQIQSLSLTPGASIAALASATAAAAASAQPSIMQRLARTAHQMHRTDPFQSLHPNVQTPYLFEVNEQNPTHQHRYSEATEFNYQTYAEVSVTDQHFMDRDKLLDHTNTARIGSFVQPEQTLLRAPLLSQERLEHDQMKKMQKNKQDEFRSFVNAHKHDFNDATTHPTTMTAAATNDNSNSDDMFFQPVEDMQRTEYVRMPFKSGRFSSELLAVTMTNDDRGQTHVNFMLGMAHRQSIGDKKAGMSGQKVEPCVEKRREDMPVAATPLSPGIHAGTILSAFCFPTRRTAGDPLTVTNGILASIDPSMRLHSTQQAVRFTPTMYGEGVSQRETSAFAFTQDNTHALEMMEARKNMYRFGQLLQREGERILSATPPVPLMEMAPLAYLPSCLDAISSHIPLQRWDATLEAASVQTSTIMQQVCKWWTRPKYMYTVEQFLASVVQAQVQAAPEPAPEPMFACLHVDALYADPWWQNGDAFRSLQDAAFSPHIQQVLRTKNVHAQLTWLWLKHVWTELTEVVCIAQVAAPWNNMMHDMQTLLCEMNTFNARMQESCAQLIELSNRVKRIDTYKRNTQAAPLTDHDLQLPQIIIAKEAFEHTFHAILRLSYRLSRVWRDLCEAVTQVVNVARAIDQMTPSLVTLEREFSQVQHHLRDFVHMEHETRLESNVDTGISLDDSTDWFFEFMNAMYLNQLYKLNPQLHELQHIQQPSEIPQELTRAFLNAMKFIHAASAATPPPHHTVQQPYGQMEKRSVLADALQRQNQYWATVVCRTMHENMRKMPYHAWEMKSSTSIDRWHERHRRFFGQKVGRCGRGRGTTATIAHYRGLHYMPAIVPSLIQDIHRMEPSLRAAIAQIELDSIYAGQHELAYDGETGHPMQGLFQGAYPMFSLPKIAQDLWKSSVNGPLHVQTRQPAQTTDGRGATRTGRQENSALTVSGAQTVLQTLNRDQSDMFRQDICSRCSTDLWFNQRSGVGTCPKCQTIDNGVVTTVYVNRLITSVLGIANVQRGTVLEKQDETKQFL